MTNDLPKQYDPREAHARWYSYWEQQGYFNADANPDKPQHTIMIPLPNVTGALHMGHALNGTLQDLLTRWKRMQGFEALWMPGTDHAGIATQAVVERRMLEEEGLTRHDIGREALVNRIWKWKNAYEGRILDQLKQMGASADWRRTRFTLDELCTKAVRKTFFKFFRDGLIYRGKRLVNWDTFLQTAVADDEVFTEEVDGFFWTFTYPVVDSDEKIAFSTTRPETMLGDTAVCVHPSDERYQHLIGKKVRIPLNGREIPIIADALLADKELGTGAVKVTPGHDQNDYACYLRKLRKSDEIGIIDLFNLDGTLNKHGGEWDGQERSEVSEAVIDQMADLGHHDKNKGKETRKIPKKHSDRSKTPVETLRSDQWFVKMGDHDDGRPGLAQLAMDAVNDGRVRFYPSRYAKTYLDWLGEKRDWCISRQLWWGHRIPVWTVTAQLVRLVGAEGKAQWKEKQDDASEKLTLYMQAAGVGEEEFKIRRSEHALLTCCAGSEDAERAFSALETFQNETAARNVAVGDSVSRGTAIVPGFPQATDAARALSLAHLDIEQDPDVLDTWFSSALWPHATLGWPDTEHDPPLDENAHGTRPVGLEGGNAVLDYFYPGSVLVTSRDIITLWVARMVLTGLYNMGDVPFAHVCVHPKILDGFGQTMSKSKGNGVDPVDLIDKYGTDGIRFTITSFAGETQDVRLPISYECPKCETLIPQTIEHQKAKPKDGVKPTVHCSKCKAGYQFTSPNYDPDRDVPVARMVSERFEYGQRFCNKLYNACRFALMNLEGYSAGPLSEDDLCLEDRWILSRLSTVTAEVTAYLGRYQFDAATRSLREFVWNEFCDWYVEMVKPRLRDEELQVVAQRMLVGVLDCILRLLHPFTPYVTEELWQRLKEIAPERGLLEPQPAAESVMIAPWPELTADWQDAGLEKRFEKLQELIVAVRNVRAVYGIAPSTSIKLLMRCPDDVAVEMQNVAAQFDNLSKTVLEAAGAQVERPKGAASFSLGETDGFIPLEGIIDRESELDRQQKEAEKLRGHITGHEKKLSNENFVSRAPADVVDSVRETLAGLKKQLESVEKIIADLGED